MNRSLWLCLALLLAACDQGTVQLEVADAPADDADRVVVQFTGVVLVRSDGETERFGFDPPKSIDLAAQVEGATATLLDGAGVDEGDFSSIRLQVSADGSGDDSFVDVDGAITPLLLDAADASRLQVSRAFSVKRLDEVRLVVDFDLRKSVHKPDGAGEPYELRPSLRVVDPEDAGAVAGAVSAARAGAAGCRPAVYVYTGHGAPPDDAGSALPPYASAIVRPATAEFAYRVAWLPAGNYTVALTCEAAADDPELDDDIAFEDPQNVTVRAEETASADFP
jgi:hypothetical protein